jgi:WD40 repeat protein
LPLDPTASALFRPDGRSLITSSQSGIRIWPIGPGTNPGSLRMGPPTRLSTSTEEGDKRAAITPDGRWLAAITGCAQITVFDLKQPGRSVVLPTQPPACFVAISPNGQWVADGTWTFPSGVRIWDAHSGKLVNRLMPNQASIGVGFSSDGQWLITEQDSYQFWAVGTWRPGRCIPRSGPGIMGPIAFSTDMKMMAIASKPSLLQLIDPATGQGLANLPSLRLRKIIIARFSPNGSCLATVNDDHPELWDLWRVRKRLQTMKLDWNLPPLPERVPTEPIRSLSIEVITRENDRRPSSQPRTDKTSLIGP